MVELDGEGALKVIDENLDAKISLVCTELPEAGVRKGPLSLFEP